MRNITVAKVPQAEILPFAILKRSARSEINTRRSRRVSHTDIQHEMGIRKKGMNIRALVLKITGFDIRGPSSTLNEGRQKTDQTIVADTG